MPGQDFQESVSKIFRPKADEGFPNRVPSNTACGKLCSSAPLGPRLMYGQLLSAFNTCALRFGKPAQVALADVLLLLQIEISSGVSTHMFVLMTCASGKRGAHLSEQTFVPLERVDASSEGVDGVALQYKLGPFVPRQKRVRHPLCRQVVGAFVTLSEEELAKSIVLSAPNREECPAGDAPIDVVQSVTIRQVAFHDTYSSEGLLIIRCDGLVRSFQAMHIVSDCAVVDRKKRSKPRPKGGFDLLEALDHERRQPLACAKDNNKNFEEEEEEEKDAPEAAVSLLLKHLGLTTDEGEHSFANDFELMPHDAEVGDLCDVLAFIADEAWAQRCFKISVLCPIV